MDGNHLYLVHHGIKGQRWGVRRFQNPDGSLTEAGRRRQYKHDAKQFKKEYKKAKKAGLDASNTVHRDDVLNKIVKEAQNTEEHKRFTEYDKQLYSFIKSSAKANGIRPDQVVLSGNEPVMQEWLRLKKAASERGRQIAERQIDSFVEASIKDIGATDTEAARDTVKQILVDEGYYRMFD